MWHEIGLEGGETKRRRRVAAVKRTVHHWAQERKHCTLSANKPGFVVISFCGARVEPAQHIDAYIYIYKCTHTHATYAVGHCENASALKHIETRRREIERGRE